MRKIMEEIKKILRGMGKEPWIVALDIVSVNAAYYLALLIRFYVHNAFLPSGKEYVSAFWKFAPFYTVLCIIIFAALKLYNNLRKYAGMNDLNRVVIASILTCAVQVLGTLLFVRRMPITYYILGAGIQFCMIAIIRFSYRIIVVEKRKIDNRKTPAAGVMVIGAGEIARQVIKHLEEDEGNAYRAACVIDSKSTSEGQMLNGIPVLGGIGQMESAIQRYDVKSVFIADPLLSAQTRQQIRTLCKQKGIALQDYTGYLSNLSGHIPLTGLLERVKGPVTLKIGKDEKTYQSGEEAIQALTGRYQVETVSGQRLTVELEAAHEAGSPEDDAWAEQHKKETGEDISFF